jgi:hypothetical protein
MAGSKPSEVVTAKESTVAKMLAAAVAPIVASAKEVVAAEIKIM